MQSNERGECKCGMLTRLAEDPRDPVEFDAQLNEYHITRKGGGGYSLIYFCPACGGRAPKSQRGSLFQKLTEAERQRLSELTKNLKTEQDVIAALGQPDRRGQFGMTIITPQKEGSPEAAQSCPVLSYNRLSEVADVHVTVYPNGQVGFNFQGKARLVQQTQETHMPPAANAPEPEPQIETSKRYDVYCIEPHQRVVVYRNARFKGAGSLLQPAGIRGGFSQFVELEQANGQSVFISRGSIFRFCEPGIQPTAEEVPSRQAGPH